MYIIFGVHVRKFFNASSGWCGEKEATRYSYTDKINTALPFGGVWRKLPNIEKGGAGFGR